MKTAKIDMYQVEQLIRAYLIACSEALRARSRHDDSVADSWERVAEIRSDMVVALVMVGAISWEEYHKICESIANEDEN